jgi:hypothetical protein
VLRRVPHRLSEDHPQHVHGSVLRQRLLHRRRPLQDGHEREHLRSEWRQLRGLHLRAELCRWSLRHDLHGRWHRDGRASGFLVNGDGLGPATGGGLYVLDAQGAWRLATFDPSWKASSGYTAVTSNGVFLVGYIDGTDFKPHVRAVPPSLSAPALTGRVSFALSGAPEILVADDVQGFTAVGTDAVIVRGAYDFSRDDTFTSRVERLPLTLSGAGTQTVTAGAPVTFLEATNRCTSVSFVVGAGARVLVGLTDRNGRRVLQLQP